MRQARGQKAQTLQRTALHCSERTARQCRLQQPWYSAHRSASEVLPTWLHLCLPLL